MVVLPLVLNRMLLSVVALGLLAEMSLTAFAIEISLSIFIKGLKLSAANVDPPSAEMLSAFVETLDVDLSTAAGVLTLLTVDWGLPAAVLSTELGSGLLKTSSLILDMMSEAADIGLLTAVLSTELGGLELLVVVSLAIGTLLFSFINLKMVAVVALVRSSISMDCLSSVSLTAFVGVLAVSLSLMLDVLILSAVDLPLPVVVLPVVLSLALKVLLSLPVNPILLETILLIEFALSLVVDLSLAMNVLLTAAGVLLLSVDDLGWLTAELVALEVTVVAVDVAVAWSLVTVSPLLFMLLVGLMSSAAAGNPLWGCTLGVSLSLSMSMIGRIIWPGRGISLCKFANFFLPRKCSSAKMAFSTVQSITTKSAIARMTL